MKYILVAIIHFWFVFAASAESLPDYTPNLEAGDFDGALRLLLEYEGPKDASYYQQVGMLYGTTLSTEYHDVCNAVVNLEKAYEMGITYARPSLDYLYGGGWMSIAAKEGSRVALYQQYKYYYDQDPIYNAFVILSENESKLKALRSLLLSSNLLYKKAKDEFKTEKILKFTRSNDISISNSETNFQEVICPVRSYR